MASCRTNYDDLHFHDCSKQQNLWKGIYEDYIKKYGISCKFLPANIESGTTDLLFGENRQLTFDQAITIKLFFESFDRYEGEGDLLDRFDIHFEDELILWIDKISTDEIDQGIHEGDLVYVPMIDALFEITFVDPELPFYLMGVKVAYKIKLKKYRQSNEDKFDKSELSNESGILDILDDESGEPETNTSFENEGDDIEGADSNEQNSIFGDW